MNFWKKNSKIVRQELKEFNMELKKLKLIARTEDDLRVVSAHLQDAIANVSDIASLEKNKIFLMQLNRFMWEDVEKGVLEKIKG